MKQDNEVFQYLGFINKESKLINGVGFGITKINGFTYKYIGQWKDGLFHGRGIYYS